MNLWQRHSTKYMHQTYKSSWQHGGGRRNRNVGWRQTGIKKQANTKHAIRRWALTVIPTQEHSVLVLDLGKQQ